MKTTCVSESLTSGLWSQVGPCGCWPGACSRSFPCCLTDCFKPTSGVVCFENSTRPLSVKSRLSRAACSCQVMLQALSRLPCAVRLTSLGHWPRTVQSSFLSTGPGGTSGCGFVHGGPLVCHLCSAASAGFILHTVDRSTRSSHFLSAPVHRPAPLGLRPHPSCPALPRNLGLSAALRILCIPPTVHTKSRTLVALLPSQALQPESKCAVRVACALGTFVVRWMGWAKS